MAWLDDIQDASFRGVPFGVEKPQTKGGRRVAPHDYPKRDTPDPEDMGRKGRSYILDAYTLGDAAIADRDRLITALDADGPGTLIHPTFGTLWVQVDDWTVNEDLVTARNICRFQITFLEAAAKPVPRVTKDTSARAGAAADTATGANQTQFAGTFTA